MTNPSSLTIEAQSSVLSGGDPGLEGDLRIIGNSGAGGSPPSSIAGGLEFKTSNYQSGFGHRQFSPDEGGGIANWYHQYRYNSANWTYAFRVNVEKSGSVGFGDAADPIATYSPWVYTYTGYDQGQITTLSRNGGVGILAASRASADPSAQNATIGVTCFAFNDISTETNPGRNVWSLYGEARRWTLTGSISTAELDVTNFGEMVELDPYNVGSAFGAGVSLNMWLPSGGSCTSTNPGYNPFTQTASSVATSASAAIGIGANGADYLAGIVFTDDALSRDEESDEASAIRLAKNQRIDWYSASGTLATSILSAVSSASHAVRLIFTDAGLEVHGNATLSSQGGFSTPVNVNGRSVAIGMADAFNATYDSQGGGTHIFMLSGTSVMSVGHNGLIQAENGALFRTPPTTYAGLPSAATVGAGTRAFISDATSNTFGGAASSGGGSFKVPVYSDGTSWRIG